MRHPRECVLSCQSRRGVGTRNLAVDGEGTTLGDTMGRTREDGKSAHGAAKDDAGGRLVPLPHPLPKEKAFPPASNRLVINHRGLEIEIAGLHRVLGRFGNGHAFTTSVSASVTLSLVISRAMVALIDSIVGVTLNLTHCGLKSMCIRRLVALNRL